MKRTAALILLGLTLTACGGGSGSPTGNRPPLPSGVEVRHPAAPTGAPVYLSLLTERGESVYQKSVAAGSTVTAVEVNAWKSKSSLARPIEDVLRDPNADFSLPSGVEVSKPGTPVLLLRWVMWQDRNSDGKFDSGEALPLLTHDRVVYAQDTVTVTFLTNTPFTAQRWHFERDWSRAEHYVYVPLRGGPYRRSLESNGLQRYELHVETPITSQ